MRTPEVEAIMKNPHCGCRDKCRCDARDKLLIMASYAARLEQELERLAYLHTSMCPCAKELRAEIARNDEEIRKVTRCNSFRCDSCMDILVAILEKK